MSGLVERLLTLPLDITLFCADKLSPEGLMNGRSYFGIVSRTKLVRRERDTRYSSMPHSTWGPSRFKQKVWENDSVILRFQP